MDLYRDPLAGLRSQIATKRGLIEGHERALPALLRALLPPALLEALARPSPPAEADPDSVDGLVSVENELDALLAAHDEAAALVPKLRECPDEVPDPPRPALRPPWAIEEDPQLDHRAALTRRLAVVEPEAFLVRWDDATYLSRFKLAGAPLVVSSKYQGSVERAAANAARTSVPRRLPAIDVHPEGAIHLVARKLHLVRDRLTGDEAFDREYVLEASPAAALVIGPDVRAAFVGARAVNPRLRVERGIAEITWRSSYDPDALLPDQVLAILLGIRAAIERA